MIYVNSQPLPLTIFSDGTSQVWKLSEEILSNPRINIEWDFLDEREVLHLLQLQQLLSTHNPTAKLDLYINYLPYARQDKPVSNTATFALNTFIKLLNTFKFNSITVLDPHNPEAFNPNCNINAVYPTIRVDKIFKEENIDIICYPDKGAVTKYTKVYDYPYVYGEKNRDQLTGHILNYKLVGDVKGCNVLIIDDICDGGKTFELLAKDLKEQGANKVILFVTHGIFSKGLWGLFDAGINKIFTKNGEMTLGEYV